VALGDGDGEGLGLVLPWPLGLGLGEIVAVAVALAEGLADDGLGDGGPAGEVLLTATARSQLICSSSAAR